ncbi:hypothetical protein AAF712_004437 [Marasmius tenuissimus]|uniref:Uncharacterized protein n=1 Tax=Marasmius tenuissimus TaxID=585030 RepID=A0ABR3A4P6_9AGAR
MTVIKRSHLGMQSHPTLTENSTERYEVFDFGLSSTNAEVGLGMPDAPNFGDTLSSGIQEVSALLPLLGTEQCERHVGTALEKGYLYAAATPLSIFGSLGIVKTAFSTVLATTTRPFYGGSWLDDAGFGTTGSVSSMVTLVKGTQQYGAEVQLQRLMKEQHIDDPEMVADIEWFGWKKNAANGSSLLSVRAQLCEKLRTNILMQPPSWNVALIFTSLISSLISVSPYPYLIARSKEHTILWLFPLLRSFGSLLCVVTVQLALQIRIHHITTSSLLLMKARKRFPLPPEEAIRDRDTLLESRLRNLRDELGRLPDPEKQSDRGLGHQTDIQGEPEARDRSQNVLLLLRAVLVVGMGMIVTGYIGCFNIVGRTEAEGGPYLWFGTEAFLAILRIALWGWNPAWDERGTGMTMRLNLRSRDLTWGMPSSSSSDHHSQTSSTPLLMAEPSDRLTSDPPIPSFPLITGTRFLSHLTETHGYLTTWRNREVEASFIAESIEDFLVAATPYVGPLRRLEAEELKGISLYCGIIPDGERKLLSTTACRDDSRRTSISILIDGNTPPYAVYTSRSQDVPGARALQVNMQDEVQTGSVTVVDQRTLNLLIDYSSRLFTRLCMADNPVDRLPLSWAVALPSLPNSENLQKSILLTEQDKTYIQIRQIHYLKSDYCIMRGNLLLGVFPHNLPRQRHVELIEWALILDSAVAEVYLYVLERLFVRSLSLSPNQLRRLTLECIRGMEDRISLEKEVCRHRPAGPPDYRMLSLYETTYDQLIQELRSLRQLPTGSATLESWEELIAILMDQPDELPTVSDLFALPPLQNLATNLEDILSFFVVRDGSNIHESLEYRNMVAFLRSSLYRLRDMKASSLDDRIIPWGPGSPEFSPPYTAVFVLSTQISKALVDQFESIQMIELRQESSMVQDTLHLLRTLSPSPSLTTVMFHNGRFDDEVTLLVTSVLQRHQRIICLAFQDCEFSDRALIDDIITTNRQKWKEEARSNGVFTFSVGCEIRPGDIAGYASFNIYQHDILLSDLTDLFAMIYIPHEGKVVPSLSLQAHAQDITLVATLTPSDKAGETGDFDDTITTQSDVAVSYDFESTSIDGFPGVRAGCYELRIRLARKAPYLFRKLTIDFIAASDGVEPPGEPGAEKRLVPDE